MSEQSEVLAPGKPERPPATQRTWYLVSSHGMVFFYIATHPDCTIKEMTEALYLTRRTIWGLVGDLKAAGMVQFRKSGRRHHYFADPDSRVHHPAFEGKTVREIMDDLIHQGWQLLDEPAKSPNRT